MGATLTLILAGAVGAMAFGALMVFVSRRSDLVALWLGAFLSCIAADLLVPGPSGRLIGMLALPCLAAFLAELRPGAWPRRVAAAVAVVVVAAAPLGAPALVQALAFGVALWATLVSLQMVRERRNSWPVVITLMALTYPLLTLDLLEGPGLEAAGFIAYVIAPGVILTRRAIRAFDAEARRAIDQAKFATDVFDSVPVALSMRDLDGRYVFVNRTWEKYYGHQRDRVIGTSPRQRATKAEADALLGLDAAALAAWPGEAPPPADFTLGDKRYLQIRTAMADSQGKLLGVLTASIDTSERQQMERALELEHRRLNLMVQSSKLGMLDWDAATRTAYYSPRFKEILGHPPDADTSGWPDYFELVHPEDVARVRERFRRHIIDSREDFHEPLDYRLRRADGTYVWVQAQGVSVRDEKGFSQRFIATLADISERREAEERLREERERLQLGQQTAGMIIMDRDIPNDRLTWSDSPEWLRGPLPASGKYPLFRDQVHPEDRERFIESRDRAIATLQGGSVEFRMVRTDGKVIWVLSQQKVIAGPDGRAARMLAAMIDITARRAQDEALRASVRLREEVERMSRHDLKTPLNSVIAVSRLLRESAKLSREDEELLSIVERAGYRILSMVNLSLDIFRMEQGTYQFRAQAVDLSEVARKVAADLESQAASKDVVINLKQSGRSTARAEEVLSYSMLANLVKNAIEAAPEASVVTVTVEGAGDAVSVHVHNEGEISPKVRPHFFQKYVTTGKHGGVGLGAYSARLMARVQQGEITMHSALDAGTTISVRLRAAESASGAGDSRAAAAPTGSSAERLPELPPLKVLVVDDDEFNRLVFRRMLPSPPLELTMAVNGRAALDAAARDWPDVALLDLEMPVMDGYEAAGRLRKMQAMLKQPLRIIAISSNDDPRSMERALNSGCDDYLVKPAPRETLWAALAGAQGPAKKPAAAAGESDPVQLDADLRATLPEFLRSRREALDELPQALAAGDREKFRRLAHKLAGSFALYGFKWAGAQCRALQDAAAQGEAAELARRVSEVREYLDKVEIR
jgi:PAS domain S-box-containing protein